MDRIRAHSSLALTLDKCIAGIMLKKRKTLHAILDFRTAPYALGDTVTWLINVQIATKNKSVNAINVIVISPHDEPSNNHQVGITSNNYVQFLQNLMPTMAFCSCISGVTWIRDSNEILGELYAIVNLVIMSGPN